MIPASWDWQKKSKNLVSLLAEYLFLPCHIRVANTPVLISSISVLIRVISGFILLFGCPPRPTTVPKH
ncbi:MAG: hypothetical protein NTZ94_15690, partial [Verrucomicrobia bacterium]|nr:hypothetical protein [Verrucomicrobiota bacterium]